MLCGDPAWYLRLSQDTTTMTKPYNKCKQLMNKIRKQTISVNIDLGSPHIHTYVYPHTYIDTILDRPSVHPSLCVCVLFSIYIHWKSFNDCHWVLKCHCLFLPNEEKILSSDRFWRYQKLYSEFHERDSLVSVGVSVRPWPRLRSFIRHVVEQRQTQTPTQTFIRINYIKLNWS